MLRLATEEGQVRTISAAMTAMTVRCHGNNTGTMNPIQVVDCAQPEAPLHWCIECKCHIIALAGCSDSLRIPCSHRKQAALFKLEAPMFSRLPHLLYCKLPALQVGCTQTLHGRLAMQQQPWQYPDLEHRLCCRSATYNQCTLTFVVLWSDVA
jgi:hypothetical protein